MAKVKIYYHQFIGDLFEDSKSPFDLNGVGIEPSVHILDYPKDKIYYECPAWSHRVSREYNIHCPVDIDLQLLKDETVASKTLPQKLLDIYIAGNSSGSTIQLHIPRFLFWTDAKNVWIESKPHPLTSLNNNFCTVSGWWNLSSWTRPVSFAFDIVDTNKPVIINRGDPVSQISFYTKNLNDTFELIKKDPSSKLIKDTYKRTLIKDFLKKHTNKLIFKEQKSKCPFSFLFNNE
jgi:hypothetical protein